MRERPLLRAVGLSIDAPGGRPLLRGLDLTFARERAAIVGRNGVGKTTLLSVLAGRTAPAEGTLVTSGERRYVPQRLDETSPGTTGESPGERRRRALERAWAASPDLLLLDEPTLDLDAAGIAWLLGAIRRWDRGLIVVSHERRLLRLLSDFFVVAESGCRHFAGDFDGLMGELEAGSRTTQEAYVRGLQRLSERERRDDVIARRRQRKKNVGRVREVDRGSPRILLNGKRGYAQESQGRRAVRQRQRSEAARRWAKATRRALSIDLPLDVVLPPPPERAGPPVVRAEGVAARVGDRTLFERVDLELSARDRLAIIGPNGAGKTTLLELLTLEREPSAGRVWADPARFGRISQNAEDWRADDSLLERLSSSSPTTDPEKLAALLVAHRFPLALAERPLASLSPGERVRAALICLFERRPVVELLVLDEPTDHLDFVGLAAIEQALHGWRGGLCVVSHDAEFLEAIQVDTLLRVDESR